VSVVPLGVLTVVVLAVILFGICTATESAAIGALGALYLAVMAKYQRQVWWWSLAGAIVGVVLGWYEGEDFASLLVAGSIGWPLEWTEIIIIFCPIFIPLLSHFQVDPILFGTMVAVNLQAAFLSPPVAMSAFYLKAVAPKHVTPNQIFAGMMPYMLIVCLCLVFMYIWPGMTLWLPEFL